MTGLSGSSQAGRPVLTSGAWLSAALDSSTPDRFAIFCAKGSRFYRGHVAGSERAVRSACSVGRGRMKLLQHLVGLGRVLAEDT